MTEPDRISSPPPPEVSQPAPAPAAPGPGWGQKAKLFALRLSLGVAGLGLLAGFFMPWLNLGDMVVVSGFSLAVSSGQAVEVLSGPDRSLLLLVPLSAALLVFAALIGHKSMTWVALISGLVILGYGFYTLVRLFIESTGFGMWLVVGSALTALAVGLIGVGRRSAAS